MRVADPALGLRKIPRKEFEQKWSGYAALFDYTIAFRTGAGKQTEPGLGLCRSWRSSASILLQVLVLAVAVSFLELLFPVFTEMVVDKVIVEKDLGLLKTICSGWARRFFFVQLSALAQEYLLSFAAVRLDTAILDFLSRQLLSLPMSYFTSRRTGDIQRRLDGARQVRQFAVQHGIGALLALVQLIGAIVSDGALQPVAHAGLSRHHAALRRADVFLAQSAAAALRRGRGEPGQIQFASDRCDQRNRSGQSCRRPKSSSAT